MNIVLSAHFDLAHPVMSMKLEDGKLWGIIDNFAGVFAAYEANKQSGVTVYLTNFEELEFDGAEDVAKKLKKEDTLVIVVDTAKESDLPAGKMATIINAYNLDLEPLKRKFEDKIHFVDGFFEQKEDETWIYGNKFGFKTFFFGIRIHKDYHVTDNEIELREIEQAAKTLVELVEFLKMTN